MPGPWFDLAVYFALIAIGTTLFGHFEDHKPKWRRLLKTFIGASVFAILRIHGGVAGAYGFLAIAVVATAIVHVWWLPKNGVNGWTGEPRERYLQLVSGKGRTQQEDAIASAEAPRD